MKHEETIISGDGICYNLKEIKHKYKIILIATTMSEDKQNRMNMPSSEDMKKMMAAMMGDEGDFDPSALLKQMGMGKDTAAGDSNANDLDIESLLSGGNMSQLTGLFGGGGLSRMVDDMMTQFTPPEPPAATNDTQVGTITTDTLDKIDDHALVATIVNHAQAHLVNTISDSEKATLSDEVDAMLTLPEGQRALLITTRAIGTIKLDGLEKFGLQMAKQEPRFLDLSAAGFELFKMVDLANIIKETRQLSIALNEARIANEGFDVTDDFVDQLGDLDEHFSEVDFLTLHQEEVKFIRENPTLFLDC